MTATARNATTWSSQVAFYLGVIGAAVGLGSIWRFPYLVGTYGGSSFIAAFTLACLTIATPLLVAEFMIGRRTRVSPPEAAGRIASEWGGSSHWNLIGQLGTLASFLIISYYTIIAGWMLAYAWKCLAGELVGLTRPAINAVWASFLARPVAMEAWHLAFLGFVTVISGRGLNRGIEVANRIRGPALLSILLGLVAYSLLTGDAQRALHFAFAPSFDSISGAGVLAAIGQAFYATGVGMAMMIAYGAYVPAGTSLIRAALLIGGSILLVSLLATLLVFPLVFRFGMDPAAGPALVFDVLPTAFAEMPGGRLVGTTFFLLLVLAALTPTIAGFEPVISWLEQRGLRRAVAAGVAAGLAWVLGLGSVLSFNLWSEWFPLDRFPTFHHKTFFAIVDSVSANILLPIGALLTGALIGWRLDWAAFASELDNSMPFARRATRFLLRYVCPVAIVSVLAAAYW